MINQNSNRWLRLSKDKTGMTYLKEVLPVGSFYHPADDFEFEITRDFLDALTLNTKRMVQNKLPIPLQLTHGGDGNKKADIVDAVVKKNSDGVDSLFLSIRFPDKAAKQEALRHDVSVHIPPMIVDSKKNVYKPAIEHLALTNYPVIHGMSQWQAFAASRISFGAEKPAGLSLCAKCGGKCGKKLKGKKPMVKKFEDELALKLGMSFDAGDDDAKKREKLLAAVQKPVTLSKQSPMAIGAVKKARKLELQAATEAGAITPATRDVLETVFCNDEDITLSLSRSEAAGKDTVEDKVFDGVILALSKNNGKGWSEKGRHQEGETKKHEQNSDNPLLRDAEKRAKATA